MLGKKSHVDMGKYHVDMGFFTKRHGKKSHVDMRFSHVNMRFFSQHGVLKKSHVNMEHLFLMGWPGVSRVCGCLSSRLARWCPVEAVACPPRTLVCTFCLPYPSHFPLPSSIWVGKSPYTILLYLNRSEIINRKRKLVA
jgi:hypothetical protein